MEWQEGDKIEWKAFEYQYKKPNTDFTMGVVIVAIAVATLAILNGNVLLVLISIIGGVVVLSVSRQKPSYCDFCIDDEGIFVKNNFYDIEIVGAYNINVDEEEKRYTLSFETTDIINPVIHIPIRKRDAEKILVYFDAKGKKNNKNLGKSFYNTLADRI